ncbi:MAG TPA: cytochrome C oxidase subunit IV family protein [Tepidisphaeraceae bacterium]|nr:cytochrome C oxidase subunit IV family protein [Tepidisphaeraceae bacterium]
MSEATTPVAGRMPEEPHGASAPAKHHKVNYLYIFFALVVLTIVTVLVAFYRFENEVVNLLLALLVASVKATLVAMFFMHLKFEGKLIYLIFFVPLVLCVLLIVALIPDILMTDPVRHAWSSSLKLFNNVADLFPGGGH